MKYESLSLFSGLNTKPATVHNQSCTRTSCDENTPSFRICRFPRQHHFPQQIRICRILHWKGLLLPQRAGNTHHVSCFLPLPRIANTSFSTLRRNHGLNIFPQKSRTENYPPHHHFLTAETVSVAVLWEASRNLRTVNFGTCLGAQSIMVMCPRGSNPGSDAS